MPSRRRKPSGLTDEDVARLRTQVGEGRRPRVALSGPQFEQGAAGTVVRIGDPVADGADFLTVRVKVNGVTDELAFAPTELSLGGRTKATGTGTTVAGTVGTGTAGTGAARTTRPRPAATKAAAAGAEPAATPAAHSTTTATSQAGAADRVGGTSAPAAGSVASAAPTSSASPTPSAASATSPAAGRRRKAPAAPTVSVTISSSGAAWSVSASRGARTIAKNLPVTPGMVTAIADLLDQAAVSEAVAEINETARQLAQQRAEELRAELSDLEAVLATHRAPR